MVHCTNVRMVYWNIKALRSNAMILASLWMDNEVSFLLKNYIYLRYEYYLRTYCTQALEVYCSHKEFWMILKTAIVCFHCNSKIIRSISLSFLSTPNRYKVLNPFQPATWYVGFSQTPHRSLIAAHPLFPLARQTPPSIRLPTDCSPGSGSASPWSSLPWGAHARYPTVCAPSAVADWASAGGSAAREHLVDGSDERTASFGGGRCLQFARTGSAADFEWSAVGIRLHCCHHRRRRRHRCPHRRTRSAASGTLYCCQESRCDAGERNNPGSCWWVDVAGGPRSTWELCTVLLQTWWR